MFGLFIFIFILNQFYTSKQSSAQTTATASLPCTYNDPFLCRSLALITAIDFSDKIFSGTITSFDGSSRETRTWERDSSGSYTYKRSNNNVESDNVVHKRNKHFFKNRSGNTWQTSADSVLPTQIKDESIIEQLGIDESLGQFFADSPVRENYSFQNLGVADCGTIRCAEYLALDKTAPPDTKKEYLFFDVTSFRLVKYQVMNAQFQAEYTFDYAVPSPIADPVN